MLRPSRLETGVTGCKVTGHDLGACLRVCYWSVLVENSKHVKSESASGPLREHQCHNQALCKRWLEGCKEPTDLDVLCPNENELYREWVALYTGARFPS